MSKKNLKEKMKEWYEKHKRGLRDAACYSFGVGVMFTTLYLGAKLNERKYSGDDITSYIVKSDDGNRVGIGYARCLKKGGYDPDTKRFMSWQVEEAKLIAQELLDMANHSSEGSKEA